MEKGRKIEKLKIAKLFKDPIYETTSLSWWSLTKASAVKRGFFQLFTRHVLLP